MNSWCVRGSKCYICVFKALKSSSSRPCYNCTVSLFHALSDMLVYKALSEP